MGAVDPSLVLRKIFGMIRTKSDLKFYLAADKFALEKTTKAPGRRDELWKFQILLRKLEYYKNVRRRSFIGKIVSRLFGKTLFRLYRFRLHKLGIKLGFEIPPNVFGPGLRINHYGNLIVNCYARVGMWCDIHQGVNIGTNNSPDGEELVPNIGSNVWIGPGAKIFGDIKVGDGAQIAANAVVNRDVANNVTVGGMPAKVIKQTGTESINVAASKQKTQEFFETHPEFASYAKEM